MDWQPIETVPRDGRPVYVKCAHRPEYGAHLMYWDEGKKRWAGYAFAAAGRVDTWWDEEAEQPTHWAPPAASE